MHGRGQSSLHALCGYGERIEIERGKERITETGMFSPEVVRSFFQFPDKCVILVYGANFCKMTVYFHVVIW